jgi:hypothetical protein
MLNVLRPSCVRTLLLCLLATAAAPTLKAQEAPQFTALDRQLARIDLGVSAVGALNKDSNGTAIVNAVPTAVNLHPGNTLGALVTLRYIKSPLLGVEVNYGYARYTHTFTPFGNGPAGAVSGGVQQNASEYTVGYIAHLRPILGLSPFASAGLGTIVFRPTPGGGEGLINQARAAYYYSVGAEKIIFSPHFGVRAQFREVFFKAPDFETNYLNINQRTTTLEPGVGFFLRF